MSIHIPAYIADSSDPTVSTLWDSVVSSVGGNALEDSFGAMPVETMVQGARSWLQSLDISPPSGLVEPTLTSSHQSLLQSRKPTPLPTEQVAALLIIYTHIPGDFGRLTILDL